MNNRRTFFKYVIPSIIAFAFIVVEESLNLYPASRNDCNTCCLLKHF